MNYIQEYLCEAVDIIVDKKLSSAGFNKAIEGTVLMCEDTTLGKYKIKYQDSVFYAYAANPNITYSVDSLVNILILGNDMSRDKIIISSIDKKITNYAPSLSEEDKYETIGSNAVTKQIGQIELCSYDTATVNIMNKFNIDNSSLGASIGAGGYLKIKLKVGTSLTSNQQAQGDYGIIFKLVFLDSKGQEQTPKEYRFSTRNINGNPYSLETPQEQIAYYKIENASRFKRIDNIQAYVENFPDQRTDFPDASDEDFPNDIFFSDLEIYGAKPLTEEELTGVYVSLTAPQGYYFSEGSTEDKTIVAEVKINGSATNRKINYYWFKENINIMSTTDIGYNMLAGAGWECLNEKKNSEWVSGNSSITVKMADVAAKKVQYKCIISFAEESNTVYEQTITMENRISTYQIEIISEQGYNFWYGNGTTVLTCKAYKNNEKITFNSNYRFIWKRIENDGGTYYYDSTKNVIFDNNVKGWYSNSKYRITINPAAIVTKNDYYCYVYDDEDNFLGYGKTSLTNSTEQTSSDFYLVLQNAQQTFIYDKNNLSPIHPIKQHKQNLPTLSFTLYDNEHQAISANKIKNEDGKIQWKIPYDNTMLIANVDSDPISTDTENKYDIYEQDTFNYSITNSYDYNNINNNILLEVTYQDITIRAYTDFTFVKDDGFGTSGSDTFIEASPNYGGNTLVSYYPAGQSVNNVYYKQNVNDLFCLKHSSLYNNQVQLFTPKLWKSAKNVNIDDSAFVWSILQRGGKTSFGTGGNTDGLIAFYLRNKDDAFDLYNNILRTSIRFNGKIHMTEIPMITVNMYNVNYQIGLKPNTGYQFVEYDKWGYNPSYDSTHPFEVVVGEGVLGNYNSIINLSEFTFEWNFTDSLDEIITNDISKNKRIIIPKDIYNGGTFNEAVYVKVYHNANLIGDIHIPIYMFLNRDNTEDFSDWDGNLISNGQETILAHIGYGNKEENLLSGVFLGKIEDSKKKINQGLFAYKNGVKLLDTSNDIILGSESLGQIKFSNTEAKIYSANQTNNSGFIINLGEGIKYNNGAFEIDSKGVVKALTLDPSIQISGDNISENLGEKGLAKILEKYTLVSTYNKDIKDINDKINILESSSENLNTFKILTESTLALQAESIRQLILTDENFSEKIKFIEDNYINTNSLNTILSDYVKSETLSSYIDRNYLETALSSYVTSETLTNTLSSYVTLAELVEKGFALQSELTFLDKSIATLLGIKDETCVGEIESIAPIISGGSISIGEQFMVDENTGLSATKANLSVNTLIYENPEDAEDVLDLIEEIKLLKEEVELLKSLLKKEEEPKI